MTMRDRLNVAGVWLNTLLLAVFPFADQIMQATNDYLPALGQYLPENIYKWVGFIVVVANIARTVQRSRQAAQPKATQP